MSDKMTFQAIILLLCFLATVEGRSRRIVCQRACPKLYSPVCGTNGVTYKNPCELTVAACSNTQGVTIGLAYTGECSGGVNPAPLEECPTFCTLDYTPVCGSDGKTYGNLCALNAANCGKNGVDKITKAYQGECTANTRSSDCNMRCYKIYAPVCGSDGVTYASHCYLNSSNCGKPEDAKVFLAYEGQCNTPAVVPMETTDCPRICTLIYEPVCGSDNVTYPSICSLKSANCSKPNNAKITRFYEGECTSARVTDDCPQICPAIYAPVCGSDNVTYSSTCNLNAVNCSRPANAKIRSYTNGECSVARNARACPKFCAMIYDPVCGSDGATYPNECTFSAHVCGKSGITLAYRGECRRNGWAVKSTG